MEVEFDVKIDAGALYDYMLRHTYSSGIGILGSAVGALGIVMYLMNGYPLYLIFGGILLFYQPVSLYLRAKKQALSPAFQKPFHYRMTEKGVAVSQGGEEHFQSWESMYRAVSTGKSLILYTGKANASIFPRKDLGEKQADVIAMISKHMPPKKVQIRMSDRRIRKDNRAL